MSKRIRQNFFIVALIASLLITSIPVSALAGESTSTDQWLVYTKYEVDGALVTFMVIITNYYTIEYTGDIHGKTINPQRQGGVIKDGQRPGYFPFSQTISRAWVKRYKDDVYYTDYEFSYDSGSIHDPNNQPYGFEYTDNVYTYEYNYNEFCPFVYWVANGTLPSFKTLQGESLYP